MTCDRAYTTTRLQEITGSAVGSRLDYIDQRFVPCSGCLFLPYPIEWMPVTDPVRLLRDHQPLSGPDEHPAKRALAVLEAKGSARARRSASKGGIDWLRSAARCLWVLWLRERDIAQGVRRLARMDERALRDIGIVSRSQIAELARNGRDRQ